VLKETMMANERWWKGPRMVALTSTEPVLYWFLLAQRPKQLSDLEWISRQIGRWGGSSRVSEGMGVNRPSVTTLRPDHGWRNSCHTQPLQTNWQERKCGGGERARRGIAKESWRNPRKCMEF
jgi:hypothetical protein